MEFYPHIHERATKELFNIISNDQEWVKEIQALATEELLRRNYTNQQIEAEKKKRKLIIEKYRSRQGYIIQKNKTESYALSEMIVVALFFPVLLILNGSPFDEFAELSKGNYRKKIWQRIVLIILSLLLWFLLLRIFI